MLEANETAARLAPGDGHDQNPASAVYQTGLPGFKPPVMDFRAGDRPIPSGPSDVTLDQARALVAAALLLFDNLVTLDPGPALIVSAVRRFEERCWRALYPREETA